MSRVGKLAVKLPSGVEASVNAARIEIKGKMGTLALEQLSGVEVKKEDDALTVTPANESLEARAMWGTVRSHLNNMVKGVTEGFSVELEINGVGYRAAIKGKVLTLTLGYSHEIKYMIPADVEVKVPQNTQIIISGASKQKVGQIAAEIMRFRPFEPYKGKGVFKKGKPGRRKEGKKK